MSRGHLEATRRVFEAFGVQRDAEAALEYLDEEVELRSAISGGPEGNTYRGHQGVRDWMAESHATWKELRVEIDELRDLGTHVLMLGRMRARGRGGGVEVESPIAWLCEFRAERIFRARGYLDLEEARRSAARAAQ